MDAVRRDALLWGNRAATSEDRRTIFAPPQGGWGSVRDLVATYRGPRADQALDHAVDRGWITPGQRASGQAVNGGVQGAVLGGSRVNAFGQGGAADGAASITYPADSIQHSPLAYAQRERLGMPHPGITPAAGTQEQVAATGGGGGSFVDEVGDPSSQPTTDTPAAPAATDSAARAADDVVDTAQQAAQARFHAATADLARLPQSEHNALLARAVDHAASADGGLTARQALAAALLEERSFDLAAEGIETALAERAAALAAAVPPARGPVPTPAPAAAVAPTAAAAHTPAAPVAPRVPTAAPDPAAAVARIATEPFDFDAHPPFAPDVLSEGVDDFLDVVGAAGRNVARLLR